MNGESSTIGSRREAVSLGLLVAGSIAGVVLAAALAMRGYGLPAAITLGLIGVVAVALRVASWRNALIGVLAAVLFVPADLYRLPSVLPFDLEPYRVLFLGLLAVWLIAYLSGSAIRIRATPIDAPMLGVALVVVASFLWNSLGMAGTEDFSVALKYVLYIGSFILAYYAFVSLLRDNTSAVLVVKIMVGMGGFLGVAAVVERLTAFNLFRHLHQFIPVLVDIGGRQIDLELWRDGGLRVAGSASHPIAFGTMLGMVMPFAASLALDAEDSNSRTKWTAAAMLIVVGMLLSGSRTAMISLALTMLVIAITRPRQRMLMVAALLAFTFAVHMFFPGVVGSFLHNFQPTTLAQQEVGNREGRLEDWPRIMQHFSAKPFLGRGPGTFTPKKFFFVDDQYLMFLVEIGAVGLLAILSMFLATIGSLFVAGHRVGGGVGGLIFAASAAALTFAVTSVTYDSVGFAQPTFMFFATAGLGMALALNAGAFPNVGRHGA